MENIKFIKAGPQHLSTIFSWLDEPHVREFWDNSPNHRIDIELFTKGRPEKSPYFDGKYDNHYWVGLKDNIPYAFILSSVLQADEELDELHKANLPKFGNVYFIDFCIGNTDYLGKGLAAPTLDLFTKFFQENIDNSADTYFIDPDENNPRAYHVYEKAGFVDVGKFEMKEGVFKGQKSHLMVKKLAPLQKS